MSSIINNTTFNNYIKDNKDLITINNYNLVDFSTIIKLEDTIIYYSNNIKILFCSSCFTNLTRDNYLNHIKKKYTLAYNTYKKSSILNNLINKINSLEFFTLDLIKEELSCNKYYYKYLPLTFNNFKCLECFYININKKAIRIHYNKEHNNNNKDSRKEASYIVSNILLQMLEGFKYNTKIYFIPKLIEPNL